jgi:hypothetical protein
LNDSDKHYVELMHAALDGEASEREMAALREYLVSNPEAQSVQSGLMKLADVLRRVEDIEPPEDLTRSILAALPPRRPAGDSVLRNKPWHAGFPILKYGYALAAGLLIGSVLAGVAFRNLYSPETSDFYGTMIAREHASPNVAVDQMKLDLSDLRGSVGLSRSGSNAIVDFDLDTRQPVEVEVGFNGSQVGLKGFSQESNTASLFEAEPGRLSFRSEGKYRSTVLLTRDYNGPIILDLRFYISGELVHHGTLRLPRSD